jgi:hypothetical protein
LQAELKGVTNLVVGQIRCCKRSLEQSGPDTRSCGPWIADTVIIVHFNG